MSAEFVVSIVVCAIILLVSSVIFWRSRRPVIEPFDGWHKYFDSREYLHPRIKLPLDAMGEKLDLKYVRFHNKYGHFLNVRQIKKLQKEPTFSKYIKKYGLEKLVYGVFKYHDNGTSCIQEFVILDTRPALDILSDKYYVQIFIRFPDNKFTEKKSFEQLFPQTSLITDRFLLYTYDQPVTRDVYPAVLTPLSLPSIEYALNDFYCQPHLKKLAETFINQLLRKSEPVKMYITGNNGCGKSTFVRQLLKHMQINYIWVTGAAAYANGFGQNLSSDKQYVTQTVFVIDEFDKTMEYIDNIIAKLKETRTENMSIASSSSPSSAYISMESLEKLNTEWQKVTNFLDKLYYSDHSYILIGNNVNYCKRKVEECSSYEFARGFFRAGRYYPIDFTLKQTHYKDICDFYMPTLTRKQKETLVALFKKGNVSASYICDTARTLGYTTCFKIPFIKAKDFDFTPTKEDFEQIVQKIVDEDTTFKDFNDI